MRFTDDERDRLLYAMGSEAFQLSTRMPDNGLEDELELIASGEVKGDPVQQVKSMLSKYGTAIVGFITNPVISVKGPLLMLSDGMTEGWVKINRNLFSAMQRRAAGKGPESGDGIDWVETGHYSKRRR